MLFNSPKQSPFLLIYPTMLFDSFLFLHFIAFSYHVFFYCFVFVLIWLFCFQWSFVFKWYIISGLNDSVMSHGNSDSAWQNIHLVNVVQAFLPPKKHLQNTCNLFVFFLHNENHFGHFCPWLLLPFNFFAVFLYFSRDFYFENAQ